MRVCNLLTGGGFNTDVFFGPWNQSFIILVLIFFIGAIAGKWLEGYGCNKMYGIIGGILFAVLTITFTCAPKWGFLGGLVGIFVGGFVIGQFIGGDETYGY